jgi:hypothetical protein
MAKNAQAHGGCGLIVHRRAQVFEGFADHGGGLIPKSTLS